MRMLDLFCGAGGAAMGYHRAGFDEIVGVDIMPQPHYPFTFIQADAMTFPLDGFNAIHASPPCQEYSALRNMKTHQYAAVLPQMRERLITAGVPWIMENVPQAPMLQSVMICGTALGIPVRRHRLFDSSHFLYPAGPCRHSLDDINVYGHGAWNYHQRGEKQSHWQRKASNQSPVGIAVARLAFDTPWMTQAETAECIPPAYTEWLGRQLISAIQAQAA